MRSLSVLLLLSVAVFGLTYAQPAGSGVFDLPGLPGGNASFAQYSGYMTVAGYGDMFYWFVESQNEPTTDPLVLWLNGGPGCSSLGGFLGENGPWFPNETLQLVENPYAWNRIANMIYLESPPGVGFSKNNAPFTFYTDNRTADANYKFLQQWFSSFSSYQSHDFYVTGESYGGHYVPELAYTIYQGNQNSSNIPINLKGVMVGNPATDENYDGGALYEDYMWSHGLNCVDFKLNSGDEGILNPYDILADVCYATSLDDKIRWKNPTVEALRNLMDREWGGRTAGHAKTARWVPEMPPCISTAYTNYLNQADVQEAIHADPTVWADCGGPPYEYNYNSIIPYWQYLLDNTDYRLMVYSGDADTVVPFIGTESWIVDLGLTAEEFWGPWYSEWSGNGQQVAGWYVNFGQFQYATVKGAGHMVPWFQPGAAFDMFQRYLTNTKLKGL